MTNFVSEECTLCCFWGKPAIGPVIIATGKFTEPAIQIAKIQYIAARSIDLGFD
jgi:hypothetical protein